jgi:galactose mutarotase-like enzyme
MTDPEREWTRIANGTLTAAIDAHGAQLMSLRTSEGVELLWQGDPASWPDRAPLLFPVIGPMPGGRIRHAGGTYPMPAHGFARQRDFTVVEHASSHCALELRADAGTRSHYPFDFLLRVTFALSDATLEVTMAVTNTGNEPLPADVGFHPGFAWPVHPGTSRDDHAVVFAEAEPAPIRRGVNDPIFLRPGGEPTPVDGTVLRLRDDLFIDNAIVFDHLNSRSLTYGPTGERRSTHLRIAFPDCPYLAIWSRPGAGFVAIEPWQGLPSPIDFEGPLLEKPGIAVIAPGATRQWKLQVTVVNAPEEGSCTTD